VVVTDNCARFIHQHPAPSPQPATEIDILIGSSILLAEPQVPDLLEIEQQIAR
jgi:hypothetical protein